MSKYNSYQKDSDIAIKTIAWILLLAAISISAIQTTRNIFANYDYENKYISYWNLADKSSTIQAKYEYINQFVNNIEKNSEKFASNNAIFLKTPDNSFKSNLDALVTLRNRLKEIQSIDINSFAYQTAIQQITSQEQGEAHRLIGVIKGCYFLESYPSLWDWIGLD